LPDIVILKYIDDAGKIHTSFLTIDGEFVYSLEGKAA
jgi:hypothetical protein